MDEDSCTSPSHAGSLIKNKMKALIYPVWALEDVDDYGVYDLVKKFIELVQCDGDKAHDIANEIGKNEDGSDIELPTTDKTIKGAITELFQDVSNGKTLVANAITDKGIKTLATDTFQTMATNIRNISGGSSSSYINPDFYELKVFRNISSRTVERII